MKNHRQSNDEQAHMSNRAKELRKRQTGPEMKLWQAIRNRQLSGLKFRRQHAIGFYVVDFLCASNKLVIELDGDSHNESNCQADRDRQTWLEQNGHTVLRFENDEVLNNLDDVLASIQHLCEIIDT